MENKKQAMAPREHYSQCFECASQSPIACHSTVKLPKSALGSICLITASPTIQLLQTQMLSVEWDAFVAKLLKKPLLVQLTSLGIPQKQLHGGLNNCP